MEPLEGGSKDTEPPKVLKTTPDSAQLNVKPKQVVLQFDEYVKANKIRDLLIVSPTQAKPVQTEIRKKSLIITFQDTLVDNTTYSVQLNGSIIDNNEGNPLQNYQLFFSTGDYIDSLYYKVKIIDAYSRNACEECIVALYTSDNDSICLQERPVYLARTNSSGVATIPHLKSDSFKAIAMKDDNKNLVLNEEEYISLYKNVQILDSMSMDTFYTFKYITDREPEIKLVKSYPGVINLTFERALNTDPQLTIDGSKQDYILNYTRDTLTTYVNASSSDTFEIKIGIDTFTKDLSYIPINVPQQAQIKARFQAQNHIVLSSNQHLVDYDSFGFKLIQDSTELLLSKTELRDHNLHVFFKPLSDEVIRLHLNDSSLQDLNGTYNLKDTLEIKPNSELSSLKLKINFTDSSTYILFLELDNKVVKRELLNTSSELTFSSLKSGKYRVRIIKDINNNGFWDNGDLLKAQAPEQLYLSELTDIRPNWDKELIIIY